MEELRVRFDHSFRASQKFSNYANWLGGGKPLKGSSSATSCYVRVPAESSGLSGTQVRGFDTDSLRDEGNDFTDGRVVYDPETITVDGSTVDGRVTLGVVDNHTKWRFFWPGCPASMTVRECTPHTPQRA